MKKTLLSFGFLLIFALGNSQEKKKFNLDFEKYRPNFFMASGWFQWGDYMIESDTIEVHSGKYSGKVKASKKGNSFGSITYNIPATYKGKTIKLEGYMKIQDVEEGFAGLLLRVDGNDEILAFDNMAKENIQGTKDWSKYDLSLPYPKDADQIYVAGLLTGKGVAWFDDFKVSIDGEEIKPQKEKPKPVYKAESDTEFDLGSNIVFPKLNKELEHNLELLGRIWGFLKYHHPSISNGDYNWDYELFRMLPGYMDVESIDGRNKLLLSWIDKYGVIEKCKGCKKTSEEAHLKPDHSWMDRYDISEELRIKLRNIYLNRRQGPSYFIGTNKADHLMFLNENMHVDMPFNDKAFLLLSLYRYWNMIEYFFPYNYLQDKNWDDVLMEYIPVFYNTSNKLEYEKNLMKLISEIDDTHASTQVGFNMVHKLRGEYFAPFKLEYIEDKFVVTDYFNPEYKKLSGVKRGDIITHINNKPIESIVDSISDYYPASNKHARMRKIAQDLLRSKIDKVNISFKTEEGPKNHNLPLYKDTELNKRWYDFNDERSYKILEGNIGYITLENIKPGDIKPIKKQLINTKGIIIDIRNYPSTFVPFLLGSYFVSKPTDIVKWSYPNIDNPGEFNFIEGSLISPSKETYKGKLVVIVNEKSQSQSEYTAMAFRAGDNTTIVGNTTAGADGNVVRIELPGGVLSRISGLGVYYPDGGETQRIGIVPDVEIWPTIQGIKEGRDELLEKAIEIIHKED